MVCFSYWPDSEQTSDWLSNKNHYENYFKVNNLQKLGSVKINPRENKTLPFLVKSLKLIADDPNGPKKSNWSTEILLEARTHTAVDIGDGNFIGLSTLRRSESTHAIVFTPLFIFRSFFPTKLRLKFDTISEVILPGYGTGLPVYNLAPQLTHRMAIKNHSNISVNLAVISDLIQSPEYTFDPLKGENKDPLWPLEENDQIQKMDAAINVRFQPKWSYLSTILVEFLPAMIFINQSGFQVFVTSETEAFIVNNLQSISTSLLANFELKIKGRETVLQPAKEFEVLESVSPSWIHSNVHQVPLNGNVTIDFFDPTQELDEIKTKSKMVQLIISSVQSRGIRQITISSATYVANLTDSPVKIEFGNTSHVIGSNSFQFKPLETFKNENIYLNDHKLPYDSTQERFVLPRNTTESDSPPINPSDWLIVSERTSESGASYISISQMSMKNPPRYQIRNTTPFSLKIEEKSVFMNISPFQTIYYDSYQEAKSFPGVNQCPVKIRVSLSSDSSLVDVLHLTPGLWALKFDKLKLSCIIKEFGSYREVIISEHHFSNPISNRHLVKTFEGTINLKSIDIILHDDRLPNSTPIMALTLKKSIISTYFDNNGDNVFTFGLDQLVICNICYKNGKKFDYPLCLAINKDSNELNLASAESSENVSDVSSISSQILNSSSLAISLTIQTESKWIRSVEIKCPKSALWIEDNFIILFGDLIQNYQKCFETRSPPNPNTKPTNQKSQMANQKAIYIEFLHIGELNLEGKSLYVSGSPNNSILVSVKSNYKLYVGCDASSLKLKEFKLLTTRSNNGSLTDLLKEHYLYESIKRIGWVAGSLEFIGSPAGLIRNVKKGIEDFVYLPIQGATYNGIGGALKGVGGGADSLVRHLASGTITSITNIANALSKNIEKISEHEEEGFGVSLLGSIAGVVQVCFSFSYSET